MNSTGKHARKSSGMNRFQIRHAAHSHKSVAKRRRSGWGRSGSAMGGKS